MRTEWLSNIPDRHQRLLDFWNSIKPLEGLPSRQDFDVPDLLPWLGDIHFVEMYENDAKYLVYGSNIAQIHNREWTGKLFSELDDQNRKRTYKYYLDVRDARRPMSHIVPATIKTKYYTWSRLFVPFADEHGNVRHILVHAILLDLEEARSKLGLSP